MNFSQRNCFLLSWRSFLLGKCLDTIHQLSVFFFSRRIKKTPFSPPRRILLSNCGGLGDVTMCTHVASEIKRHFPLCQLGFLAHKESSFALDVFSSIDWIHTVNYAVRPNQSILKKIISFLKFSFIERPYLAKEIEKIGYDAAIELRPFFPNMISIFWKAKIPLRIGFISGGNSFLLNSPSSSFKEQYIPLNYRFLLEKVGIRRWSYKRLLHHNKQTTLTGIRSPYFVFHLFSSQPNKNFPIPFWQTLYESCTKKGWTIYFSGKGDKDRQLIHQVVPDQTYNLCNQLSWNQFVQLIHQSQGLVSVDSTAVHLAAYFHIPCAVLYKIVQFHKLWCPPVSTCSAFGMKRPVTTEEVIEFLEKTSPISTLKTREFIPFFL